MKANWIKSLSVGVIALSLGLVGCGQKEEAPASQDASAPTAEAKKEIKIGTTPGDFANMVKESIKPIMENKGYTVTLIEFTDYVRPNLALNDGDIDLNVFQHKPYLDQFKAEHKLDITEVFQVPTAPLGLYSGKLKSLDEVKDGVSVSAANDPSNFARALVMLDDLGWLKLKENINPLTASKKDIAENPKNIKIVELEAAQLPRSRDDVDFAVVNGNYAMDSGMKLTDTLFQEPSFAYVNWSAIRTADKDQQWVKDITDAYNSDEFKAYTDQKFAGYKLPAAWGAQPNNTAASETASE